MSEADQDVIDKALDDKNLLLISINYDDSLTYDNFIEIRSQVNKILKDQVNNLEKQSSESKKQIQEKTRMAEFSEDQLRVALKQEIGQGLAEIQREKDRVVVTVGSAGAFNSGSAKLTKKAREIMKKIAKVSAKGAQESTLLEGTPILYRAGDQPNNALSLNVLNSGDIAATAGTSGVVYAVTDQKKTKEDINR